MAWETKLDRALLDQDHELVEVAGLAGEQPPATTEDPPTKTSTAIKVAMNSGNDWQVVLEAPVPQQTESEGWCVVTKTRSYAEVVRTSSTPPLQTRRRQSVWKQTQQKRIPTQRKPHFRTGVCCDNFCGHCGRSGDRDVLSEPLPFPRKSWMYGKSKDSDPARGEARRSASTASSTASSAAATVVPHWESDKRSRRKLPRGQRMQLRCADFARVEAERGQHRYANKGKLRKEKAKKRRMCSSSYSTASHVRRRPAAVEAARYVPRSAWVTASGGVSFLPPNMNWKFYEGPQLSKAEKERALRRKRDHPNCVLQAMSNVPWYKQNEEEQKKKFDEWLIESRPLRCAWHALLNGEGFLDFWEDDKA